MSNFLLEFMLYLRRAQKIFIKGRAIDNIFIRYISKFLNRIKPAHSSLYNLFFLIIDCDLGNH